MSKNLRKQFFAEFIADFICLFLANLISFVVFKFIHVRIVEYPIIEWIKFAIILVSSFIFVFLSFHKSIDIRTRSRVNEATALLKNTTLTYLVLIALLAITKNAIVDSRYLIISSFIGTVLLSTIARYYLKRWLTGYFTRSKTAVPVGVITTSEIAEAFIPEVKNDWNVSVSGIALLDYNYSVNGSVTTKTKTAICDIPVICQDDSFMNWIRSAPLDEVFINLPYKDISEVQDMVEELEDMGITVHVNIPTLSNMLDESKFNNINCKIYAGYPMATFSATIGDKWLVLKRISDVIFGLIGCILSIPIIALTAIPLLIESPGTLFFKQPRVGKNGRIFTCYKLRSMCMDAEAKKAELMNENEMQGHMFKMDKDPRITKVGAFIRKTSIDELPQFFNVLKGDMSLIGTRPPTVDEFNQYESRHKRRLSMRPGITGMWQVSGRSNIQDFEEVVALDCKYIDEWSPFLDIKIFFKTIFVLLTFNGAK